MTTVGKIIIITILLMTRFAPNCDLPRRITDACKDLPNLETILGEYKKCFPRFLPPLVLKISHLPYLPDSDEDKEDHVPFVVIDNFQEKFGAAVSLLRAFPKMCLHSNLQCSQKRHLFLI